MSLEDIIEHAGVKGMKWGKRKSSYKTEYTVKTKYGDSITVGRKPISGFTKFVAKHIPSVANNVKRSSIMTLRSKDGKTVGSLQTYKESKDSLNIVWVSVNSKNQGKGYAQAVVGATVKHARKKGLKKVTLEVPGNAGDARHIYEKLGFKDKGSISDEDDVWGGLTRMEKKL